jgi:hypothetical protein
MSSQVLVLDPALLVWDRSDYEAREHDYWELVDDFMVLLELIDTLPHRVVLSSPLSELIIEAFPADQLYASSGLHDFTRVVYTFLARYLEAREEYPEAPLDDLVPDLLGRPCFSVEVASLLSNCLSFAFNADTLGSFASHSLVWDFPQGELTASTHPGRSLVVRLGKCEYDELRKALTREYEAHDKHHPLFGYGSRLPHGLTDAEVQKALDVAMELKDGNCLCARVKNGDVILVFRRHHQNKYHAYPIDSSEYAKYGIKPDIVPAAAN